MSLYLRLSVTDRCNFFCRYCRPSSPSQPHREGRLEPARTHREKQLKPARAQLEDTEIVALVRHMHRVGHLRKVRLTGGDPLMRPRLAALVRSLRELLPEAELCLTTNGSRLAAMAGRLRGAGLDRLNVSIDSLSPAAFSAITGADALDRVVAGIDAAREAGFSNLKLNAVLLRSGSGLELGSMVRFAAARGAELRLIELMPMGVARRIYHREFMPAARALDALREELRYLGPAPGSATSSRHRFLVDGRDVTVGFITPISEPFCGRCDRLRLDSRGRLLSCLRRQDGVDLLTLLREGRPEELEDRVAGLLGTKGLPDSRWPAQQMALIGG